jgi:hypothetical protein
MILLLVKIAALIAPWCLIFLLAIGDAREKDPHTWVYRNPACRTCSVCNQHEIEECWAWDYERRGLSAGGWWEVYRPGDMSKHLKK